MRTAVVLLLAGVVSLAAGAAVPQSVPVKGMVSVTRSAAGKSDPSNVVVTLKPEAPLPMAAEPPRLKIVQQNKRFTPHLLVVTVGTVVDFPNLDPFFHNAFSLFEGKRFDLGLYERGTTKSVTFGAPGVCYIFCNIHPEMSAVVVVVDTPYYALSNAAGEFALPGVPPGRYALSVWHERNAPAQPRDFPKAVAVSGAAVDLGTIRMVESTQVIAPHTNKYGRDYTPVPAPGSGYIIIR